MQIFNGTSTTAIQAKKIGIGSKTYGNCWYGQIQLLPVPDALYLTVESPSSEKTLDLTTALIDPPGYVRSKGTINWGDGKEVSIDSSTTASDLKHTYSSTGKYTITIKGEIYWRDTGWQNEKTPGSGNADLVYLARWLTELKVTGICPIKKFLSSGAFKGRLNFGGYLKKVEGNLFSGLEDDGAVTSAFEDMFAYQPLDYIPGNIMTQFFQALNPQRKKLSLAGFFRQSSAARTSGKLQRPDIPVAKMPPNLTELNLSRFFENRTEITSLPSNIFYGLPNTITTLNLSAFAYYLNKMTSQPASFFNFMPSSLTSLNISSCFAFCTQMKGKAPDSDLYQGLAKSKSKVELTANNLYERCSQITCYISNFKRCMQYLKGTVYLGSVYDGSGVTITMNGDSLGSLLPSGDVTKVSARSMFANCTGITGFYDDIIDQIANVTDGSLIVQLFFQNCTGITRKLPTKSNLEKNIYFTGFYGGCKNASNYQDLVDSGSTLVSTSAPVV